MPRPRASTSCSRSTPKRASSALVWPVATHRGNNARGRCWARSRRRSRRPPSVRCLRASLASRSNKRSGCAPGSAASWTTRCWNRAITSLRTRCSRWRLDELDPCGQSTGRTEGCRHPRPLWATKLPLPSTQSARSWPELPFDPRGEGTAPQRELLVRRG